MARASAELIEALRKTARMLSMSDKYQWGHMGACNCGFLAQEVTLLKKEEIHTMAMQRYGDWSEQLNDYCPSSGLPFDALISDLIAFGFDSEDLKNLERLADANILRALPAEQRNLTHNKKNDVILYLETWARLLEMELIEKIKLPDLGITKNNFTVL